MNLPKARESVIVQQENEDFFLVDTEGGEVFEVNASAETEYERVSGATLDEMATFSPSLDIMAAAHVKAHVRMFMN